MPRKTRVFLVRHGESEANLDNTRNAILADHKIQLSGRGVEQALEAGGILFAYLRDHVIPASPSPFRLRVWRSPYDRTRQTEEGLWRGGLSGLEGLGGVIVDRREDDLLREQEFGLFDGVPDEDLPKVFPLEHAQYAKYETQKGRYFARMPMGESRADVSLRQRLFNGTVERDREKHGIDNVVLVSHGVTIRCHIKERCHLPYEWIEEERNPGNCSIRLIEDGVDMGYIWRGHKAVRGHEHQEKREGDGVSFGAGATA
jgi:broad specificity phosphatase PhoE